MGAGRFFEGPERGCQAPGNPECVCASSRRLLLCFPGRLARPTRLSLRSEPAATKTGIQATNGGARFRGLAGGGRGPPPASRPCIARLKKVRTRMISDGFEALQKNENEKMIQKIVRHVFRSNLTAALFLIFAVESIYIYYIFKTKLYTSLHFR